MRGLTFLLILLMARVSFAACAATTRTWQANANTTAWNTTTNWVGTNIPDTNTENAYIIADWKIPLYPANNYTLSCLEIASGSMTMPAAAQTLTLVGDYFRNLNAGSLLTNTGAFEIQMSGTSAQTFENYDSIPKVRISNATTTTFTKPFTISNTLTLDAGMGTLSVQGDLTLSQATTLTIPASATFIVESGVTLTLNGSLTVAGIFRMESGSTLRMPNGSTLTVNSGGTLKINGVSGNAAIIESANSSSTITITANGTVDATYASISRLTTNGINFNSSVTRFDNINIYSIPSSGRGITVGAGATLPGTMTGLGFFQGSGGGPFVNIHANAYVGAATTVNSYSGIGGAGNETDTGNKINWGSAAPATVQIQNLSASGAPPSTIAKGSAYTHFGTFGFSLSTTATAADITAIKFSFSGTNSNSDIAGVKVYKDADGNCTYNAGVDAQVGGTYTTAGSPPYINATFSAGDINISNTTAKCVHVLVSTAANARTNDTIGVEISSTTDVTNSQSYAMSSTSGPPVSIPTSTITGTAEKRWNGGTSTAITLAANWTASGVPSSTIDCTIGSGYSAPALASTLSCLNTTFASGGTITWSGTNIFQVYGALTMGSPYTFTTATTGNLNFVGASNQSVNFNGVTFPGNMTVATTAGGVVTMESSGTVSGTVTVTTGTLRIASGVTFNVTGSITVATGGTLDIEPGGILTLGNGSSITVNGSGVLELLGSASQSSQIKAINNASNYTITVNGTIKAQYYTLSNLGTTGLTIAAAATIDPTYHLQNGTFTYPGANSANLLRLLRQVPTNTMDNMSFGMNGSTASSVISVFTSTTAGTVTIANYSGDRTGATYTNAPTYTVTWGVALNELKLTQESTAPATVNQGDIATMGRWGFQQATAGAFSDTDITSIKITLTGTGSAGDVDSATLYYDSACAGTGGVSLGTQSFSGSPAIATFSGLTGVTVQAHATTPPKRCVYAVFNINSLATNAKTVGAQIAANADVTNSMTYAFNSGFAAPVNLGTSSIVGTTTQWTGATSTAWTLAGNWTSGVPTSSMNCIINSVTNNPIISSGTQVCKSVTIGNGTLTFSGGSLEIYGSLANTGTISGSSNIIFRDNGVVASSQNIDSATSTIATLSFNKTAAGGSVNVTNNLTVTNALAIATTNNFTLNVNTNYSLTLNGGLTLSAAAATLDMKSGSNLLIAAGQTLLVSGGTLKASGTNDAYPQTLSTKAKFSNVSGTGTWTFSATSGTLNLTGYYFEWLDANGLNISGTTNVTSLDGGQLRNLSTTSGMKALQLTTSGTLPSTVTNFGWNWGPGNSVPAQASSYWLAYSTGCTSRTVDFDQWFGDFWPYTTSSTAAHTSAASCTILISTAKSPVELTKFNATPYDNKVVIDWITGNEWDHQGFNVYRSLDPQSGFVQVNNQIIRNDLFSTNIHGTYAFIDTGVVNDTNYYYMLEDISLIGERKLHGPISAKPQAALGTPLLISAGVISQNGNTTSPGTGNGTPGDAHEISRNVMVLSQTQNYLRLKITVPALSTVSDVDYPTYKHLSIQDYNPTIEEGSPELLMRTLMIKLPSTAGGASFSVVDQQKQTLTSQLVAPAPKWVASGAQYAKQWYVDAAVYGTSQMWPAQTIALGDAVVHDGVYYLPIVVKPVSYNPVTQVLEKTDDITIDLFLNGQAPWQSVSTIISPWTHESSLKIGVDQSGFYQITYADLYNAGVVAPFNNQDIDKLKLRVGNNEIPMQVISGDSVFNAGDKLRFYAPHFNSDEDKLSYLLLYKDTTGGALRATDVSADPTSLPQVSNSSFSASAHFEQNNVAVFNEPFTEQTDHFVWQLIYGISGGARTTFSADMQLPNLDNNSDVTLQVNVKGKMNQAINPKHHLIVKINNSSQPVAQADFESTDLTTLQFNVSGQYFVPGLNKIEIEATGENLASGDYDFVYIDSIDARFKQLFQANNNEVFVQGLAPNKSFTVSGFSSNSLLAYDVSSAGEMYNLTGVSVVSDGGSGYNAQVGINSSTKGRKIWLGPESNLKAVSSLKLTYGSDLQNTNNQADILYIGERKMLEAFDSVDQLRVSQGYKTYSAAVEDIYNEFGLGQANVQSVKDFIQFAINQWQVKPKYIVLLGDGTYDPKGWSGPANAYRVPIKFKKGASFDYASDSWFVTPEGSIVPTAVVARIPAQNPEQLFAYANKVLSYESGETKPSDSSKISFISDKPHYSGEDFIDPINQVVGLEASQLVTNSIYQINRKDYTDVELKNKIKLAFSDSSVVNYMGHGAEDIWADSTVFDTSDVDTLTNTKYPVVAAMNCLSGHFYEDSLISMAEKMVLAPDKGAIAFWGSTSMTPPSAQSIYQSAFYDNLFVNNVSKIGDLTLMAKTQGAVAAPHEEVLGSWVVIGDPIIALSVGKKASGSTQLASTAPAAESSSGGAGCFAFAANDPQKSSGQSSFFAELGFGLMILFIRRILKWCHPTSGV